jgi:hypothetical protein
VTEEAFRYSCWDQVGRGRDGARETMATGRVIYVLSREIAGNSTSAVRAWSSRSVDALSREEIWAKEQGSARFGTGSRCELARIFGKDSSDRQQWSNDRFQWWTTKEKTRGGAAVVVDGVER